MFNIINFPFKIVYDLSRHHKSRSKPFCGSQISSLIRIVKLCWRSSTIYENTVCLQSAGVQLPSRSYCCSR